jgi:hypothetical protein
MVGTSAGRTSSSKYCRTNAACFSFKLFSFTMNIFSRSSSFSSWMKTLSKRSRCLTTILWICLRMPRGVPPWTNFGYRSAATIRRSELTRTRKNSSRFDENIPRNFKRSSNGTFGSSASWRTRSLKDNQLISRLTILRFFAANRFLSAPLRRRYRISPVAL